MRMRNENINNIWVALNAHQCHLPMSLLSLLSDSSYTSCRSRSSVRSSGKPFLVSRCATSSVFTVDLCFIRHQEVHFSYLFVIAFLIIQFISHQYRLKTEYRVTDSRIVPEDEDIPKIASKISKISRWCQVWSYQVPHLFIQRPIRSS